MLKKIHFQFSNPADKHVSMEEIIEFETTDWKSFDCFDEFIDATRKFIRVVADVEIEKWKASVCSCWENKKKYMCVHVIAMAIHLEILKPSDDFVPIHAKRNRGRPKKAPKGLHAE